MINHIRGNTFLVSMICIHILYVAVGLSTERPFVFNVISILATIAGAYGVWVYSGKVYEVLWLRRRYDAGAHLKIVGVWNLACGALYAGLWRGAYISMGSPREWLMTWHSSYGWLFVMVGMFLVTVSRDAIEEGYPMPRAFWIILGGSLLFVLGVVAGSYLT